MKIVRGVLPVPEGAATGWQDGNLQKTGMLCEMEVFELRRERRCASEKGMQWKRRNRDRIPAIRPENTKRDLHRRISEREYDTF